MNVLIWFKVCKALWFWKATISIYRALLPRVLVRFLNNDDGDFLLLSSFEKISAAILASICRFTDLHFLSSVLISRQKFLLGITPPPFFYDHEVRITSRKKFTLAIYLFLGPRFCITFRAKISLWIYPVFWTTILN